MRIITIGRSRHYETAVSDVDYDYLCKWLWTFAVSHKGGDLIYARRSIRVGDGNVTVLMHRVVVLARMGQARPSLLHTCDHRDGDSLNNQRRNLRWATPAEQMATRARINRDWAKIAARREADQTIPF
jgi:hypothetical protein